MFICFLDPVLSKEFARSFVYSQVRLLLEISLAGKKESDFKKGKALDCVAYRIDLFLVARSLKLLIVFVSGVLLLNPLILLGACCISKFWLAAKLFMTVAAVLFLVQGLLSVGLPALVDSGLSLHGA